MRRPLRQRALLLAGWLLAARAVAAEPGSEMARPFHVIAHRGVSAEAPENTLPAFERALAIGVVEVELDVQLSRDGVPVLFHDRQLDDKTALRGPVRDHAAEELTRADVGAWFDRTHPGQERRFAGTRLTTLRAVFEAFGARLSYHVEIKDELEATPARVIEAVAASGLEGHVMVTSFSRAQLDRVQRGAPAIPLCWLLKPASPERIDQAAEAGFAMVGVKADELTEPLVRQAQARGLEIRAYGVETDAQIERVLATGCNGLTIDQPQRVVSRLLQRQLAPR